MSTQPQSRSKKEAIIQAFAEMNIERLDLLLDDSKTYQEASKELFLEKLEKVFERFRSNNNSKLIPQKGKCGSTECSNHGHTGYSFLGDQSNQHLDLIFEENETEYYDIFCCAVFSLDDKSIDFCEDDSISITVYKDEEEDFKPSIDYCILMQKCEMACEELYQNAKPYLSKEYISYWVEKHRDLSKRVPSSFFSDYVKFEFFTDLYYELSTLANYQLLESKVIATNNDYHKLDSSAEHSLVLWLARNEDLFRELCILDKYCTRNDDHTRKTDEVTTRLLQIIPTSDYTQLQIFLNNFEKFYSPMFEKYWVQPENGEDSFIDENGEPVDCTIEFLLKKRGIIS